MGKCTMPTQRIPQKKSVAVRVIITAGWINVSPKVGSSKARGMRSDDSRADPRRGVGNKSHGWWTCDKEN